MLASALYLISLLAAALSAAAPAASVVEAIIIIIIIFLHDSICVALYSLCCAEVPLRNCSLTRINNLILSLVARVFLINRLILDKARPENVGVMIHGLCVDQVSQ